MSELDVDADAFLRRAKRGLSPSADDAARVRGAVSAALLAAGGGVGVATASKAHAGGVNAALAKLGLAVALAAATGVGGYVLGYRAATADLRAAMAAVPAPVVTAVERREPKPAAPEAPVMAPTDPATSPRPQRPTAASAPLPLSTPSAESPLEIETRLLARVERSLRDNNPRLALGLLGELDREVPGGQLTEERQAGRVMAHCALGSPTAAKLAADFTARYASSAYRARIEQACAPRATDHAETD